MTKDDSKHPTLQRHSDTDPKPDTQTRTHTDTDIDTHTHTHTDTDTHTHRACFVSVFYRSSSENPGLSLESHQQMSLLGLKARLPHAFVWSQLGS